MKHISLAVIALLAVLFPAGLSAEDTVQSPYIPSILVVESDDEVSELVSQGVIVWHRRADMALCAVPRGLQLPRRLGGRSAVVRSRRAVPALDYARPMYGADRILTGEGLNRPYTGSGVVVGLCDIGLDPSHIGFLDEQGKTRVKRVAHYNELFGERTVLDSPEEILAWTDSEDQTHGSHVLNIMAGGYNGIGLMGMAPGAEIVATGCQLYDAGILACCEDIVAYAKEVGKPCVINLSLANYSGPHDGTSLFCRYMDEIAKDAIVCLASGNGAGFNISKRLLLTESKPSWRVLVGSSDWTQYVVQGYVDAWSADASPTGLKLLVYDDTDNKCVYESQQIGGDGEFYFRLSADEDENLAKYLWGTVETAGYVDETNGRWVTEIAFDTGCNIPSPINSDWARYRLALEFNGAPGTLTDICISGGRFNTYPGYAKPGSELSISDLCTGYGTISVGMYNSRATAPSIGGSETVRISDIPSINLHSSYGTLLDGRVFPHTVAPGSLVVSAANTHYTDKHPDVVDGLAAVCQVDGKNYYWWTESGTSMACPYTAGVIATWLEADPTMTVYDVRKIISMTNKRDVPDPDNPAHGHGWLQPYEGMKLALLRTAVAPGAVDAADPAVVISGDIAEILNPAGTPLRAEIFDASGRCVRSLGALAERVSAVDISGLAHGVYIIRISGQGTADNTLKFTR